MRHPVGAADSRGGGSPDPKTPSQVPASWSAEVLQDPQGTAPSSGQSGTCCHPEGPVQWEFPNGDRVTLGRTEAHTEQAGSTGVCLHGQHVPGAHAHHTLARQGILGAWHSLLAEAGLCLEPPNCGKEHLGTEARVSPTPICSTKAPQRKRPGSSRHSHR